MTRFRIATTIEQGPGSMRALAGIGARRVLLVADPALVGSPAMGTLLHHLGEAEVALFDSVLPDPDVRQISESLALSNQIDPDTIIGFGGGSALDTAKSLQKMLREMGRAPTNGFVAIPSTSGSGSEVTSFAVVTSAGRKLVLVSDDMSPDMAILDPGVTLTLPPSVTADTGMDAVTHALEAYVCTKTSDFSDAFAEKSLQLAFSHLESAVADGHDIVAREKMHNAASMAAIAFDNSGLGITHSLAHALGARFELPHGRLNALLLPAVMEFNAGPVTYDNQVLSPVAKRYADIARQLGLEAASRRNLALGLCTEVRRLRAAIGIPDSLTGMGLPANQVLDCIPELAEVAMTDTCTSTNPVEPTIQDLSRLLRSVV